MPPPVILRHVAQRGVDATLRRHGVRARGKQLGDAPADEEQAGGERGGGEEISQIPVAYVRAYTIR